MELQKTTGKSLLKILKFLPKATSSVTFQNPPIFSPAKDKRPSEKTHKSNLGIGFSGPVVSIVPSETRRKIKNDSKYKLVYEPTSPRVSCMGQVKCKHYRKLTGTGKLITNKPTNKFSRTTSYTPARTYITEEDQEKGIKIDPVVEKSKKKSGILSLFRCGSRRMPDATENMSKTALTIPKAPCLKRFSSGRDAFMSFDWTTQVAPLAGETEGEEVAAIPSSAPVMVRNKGVCDKFVRVGGVKLEPRKEINLWKRRTMAQPQPLQVHAAI
ncbi:hypothetical protein L1987_79054 [Smallanthus sonchifolius]|uniref:Uncharacterized protein n=1 Tax=Smallanthus sonchifolius TaxID=185202 RepID=A0ACB8ZFF1_9ASTR|nr:hypothetical protein L1987_79054 [Smallanthus sonchifolius]